jgi:2-polyprenyl-6-methoxyphenol hydroxylase-like FAD-dependent oxidoreductase
MRDMVVIAGGGPTGLMLAAELALAGVEAVVLERRTSPELESSRAGGVHARTLEVLDQRGIAERFLEAGTVMQTTGFAMLPLDLGDFPTRHPYGLALFQNRIEELLAEWAGELGVRVERGREIVGVEQDGDGVAVLLADGSRMRAAYLAGCDGGRSAVRKAGSTSRAGRRRRAT